MFIYQKEYQLYYLNIFHDYFNFYTLIVSEKIKNQKKICLFAKVFVI